MLSLYLSDFIDCDLNRVISLAPLMEHCDIKKSLHHQPSTDHHPSNPTMILRTAQTLTRRAIQSARHTQPRILPSTSTIHLNLFAPLSCVNRGFASASSPWKDFPMAPPDPIIGLTEAYLKDDSPDKVCVCLLFA
jgi:hypothetical protein